MDLRSLSLTRIPDIEWVAFDTEATGYSNVSDRLVEVAGVRFRLVDGKWQDLGEFTELAKPGRPIPPEVIAIHGIHDEEVADSPPVLDVLDRFFVFARDAVLIAHYAPFDVGAIAFEYARHGRDVPQQFIFDTFMISKGVIAEAENHSLETLAKHLKIDLSKHHRALPDAIATAKLFQKCVERLGDPKELEVSSIFAKSTAPLSFEEFSTLPYDLPQALTSIDDAISQHKDLLLEYRGGSRGLTPRRVTPTHLFARDGHIFLEGICHVDKTRKSFRIDRIEKAELSTVS